VPAGLRYVVNAGGAATDDWTRLTEIAAQDGALLNSTPDQELGADPATGATWGYQGDSGTYGDASGDLYSTLRWARDSGTLTYSFDGLTPGAHTVHLGYYDPWSDRGRRARVEINGTEVEQARPFAGRTAGAYEVEVGEAGTIEIVISEAAQPDVQVSFVMIAAQAAAPERGEVPLRATARSLCIGGTAHVAVLAVNTGRTKADVRLTTPFGDRKLTGIRRVAAVPFDSGAERIAAGTATVAGYTKIRGVESNSSYTVPYSAISC